MKIVVYCFHRIILNYFFSVFIQVAFVKADVADLGSELA